MTVALGYTYKDLTALTLEELGRLQRFIAIYIGTSEEREARRLNHMILDELGSRSRLS